MLANIDTDPGRKMETDAAANLQELARELIAAFGLTYAEAEDGLANPLMRWLEYRERYIEPRSRRIAKSEGFYTRVPAEAADALAHFESLVTSGADLNPYLSRSTKRTDTSGDKPQRRTDGLWADWGIHHAHLTEEPVAPNAELSVSSDWLLFFIAADDVLAFIDVRPHKESGIFQAHDLVEKAIRSWPRFAERYRANVLGLSSSPSTSPNDIAALRKAGINQPLEIDGKVYMPPGMGMTTAATPMRVTLLFMHVLRNADALLRDAQDTSSWIHQAAIDRGLSSPRFRLVAHDGVLARAAEDVAWHMPEHLPENSAWSAVQNAVLPRWAGKRLEEWRSGRSAPAPVDE